MTPHISAKKEEIAKTVFLAGDPLRAKFVAENYLENPKLVSQTRGIYFYTGTYGGKEVTVGASGMGFGSMGIYATELYDVYGVERIIRIGTAGSFLADLKNYELVLCDESISDCTCFCKSNLGVGEEIIRPSEELNGKIVESAKARGIKLNVGRVFSSNVYYDITSIEKLIDFSKALCVEMESYALFSVAKRFGRQAACLLTISDNIITMEETTPEEREKSLVNMIEVALGIL